MAVAVYGAVQREYTRMRCIHPSQRCSSSWQMTDNISEIETTALAQVACAPQESGVLLTDCAAAYPSVNHSCIFSVIENTGLPAFLCRFLRNIYRDSITHVEFSGAERGQSLWPEEYDKAVLRVVSLLQWPLTRSSDGSQESIVPKNPDNLDFLQSLHNALTLTISPLLHSLLEG